MSAFTSSQAPRAFFRIEAANHAERLPFFAVWELGSFARIFYARENPDSQKNLTRAHVCIFPPNIPEVEKRERKAGAYQLALVRESLGAWEVLP